MTYRFQSKAGGDVLMLRAAGDQVLRAMNRLPAAQGIIEPGSMPAAVRALDAAMALEESAEPATTASTLTRGDGVALRLRAWPLVQMLQRAQAAGVPVVWRA